MVGEEEQKIVKNELDAMAEEKEEGQKQHHHAKEPKRREGLEKTKEENTANTFADKFLSEKNSAEEQLTNLKAKRKELTKNEAEDSSKCLPVVKLRNKNKMHPTNGIEGQQHNKQEEEEREESQVNGGIDGMQNGQRMLSELDGDTVALMHRAMGALYEMNPELENSHDEIRKLDSQLDHLNDYMDRVEERIKAHSERLMETLRQQREDRERRRRSFHERLEQNRQEDDDFQQQLSSILSRVDSMRDRTSEETDTSKLEGSDRS